MQFVDKALARRLESCEEMPQVLYARVFQEDAARYRRGGRRDLRRSHGLLRALVRRSVGRLAWAWTGRSLRRISITSKPSIASTRRHRRWILTPLHGPEVFEMFKERGYAIAELNNVLFRKLERGGEVSRSAGALRDPAQFQLEEAEATGAIVESAFFPDGAPEAFRGLITPLYQMEDALAFVATIDGKPVACGTGLVIPEHRVFALCGAGTLDRISRTRPANCPAAGAHGGCN